MKSESAAIKRLTKIQSEVSSHYFIKNNGKIISMVPDLYIAWHAGVSCWKNKSSLNKNSIGIEISNPGHSFNYKKFSISQIKSILKIGKFLIRKYKIKPDYQEARVLKLHQQAHICDWNSIEEDRQLFPLLGTSVKSVNPFPLLSLEDAPERHYLRSKAYAKDKFPQNPIPLPAKPIKRPARIRIGYFSSDFKKHPVAYLIAKVIKLHNRDKFKIFAYSLMGKKEDDITKDILELVNQKVKNIKLD